MCALFAAAASAFATDGTWLGGTGNYTDTTKWSAGVIASGTGATMTTSTSGTITVNSAVTLGAITGSFQNGTSLTFTGTAGQSLNFAASSGTPAINLFNWFSRYDYFSSINITGTQGLTYIGKSNVLVLKSGVTWTGFSGTLTIAPNSDGSMVYAQAANVLPAADLTMTPGSSTGGFGNTKLVLNAGANQTVGALNSTISGTNTTYISSYSANTALIGNDPSGTGSNGYSTLTIGATNSNGSFAGKIGTAYLNGTKAEDATANLIHIVKNGTGSQTFSGALNYSGTTTINNGSIVLTGTHAAFVLSGSDSGAYVVNAGGILGGTGLIKPSSAAASGTMVLISGTLAPGTPGVSSGIGTLTLDGTNSTKALLAFASGGVMGVDLGAGLTADKVSIANAQAGDVSFTNTVINFNDPTSGGLTSGTYTLVHSDGSNTYTGLTLDGSNYITAGLSIGSGLNAYSGSKLQVVGNDIVLKLAPTAFPGAPSNITTTTSGTLVNLSWTAGNNATSYTIYRSTSPNGVYTSIGTSFSTGYVDNSASNGVTYYYKVTSSNNLGESSASSNAAATPLNVNTISVIGVHLRAYNTYGMAVSDTAGIVHVLYWNNLLGPVVQGETTSLTNITNQLGVVIPGITASWTAGNTTVSYNNGGTIKTGSDAVTVPPATNDPNLFASVFDQYNGTASTLTVTGIPYSSYDAIFYVYDDGSSRGGVITIGSTTYFIRSGAGTPAVDGSGYVQSDDTSLGAGSDVMQGNFVRFSGLSGSTLSASFVAQNMGDSTQRLKIAGFQIVSHDAVSLPTQVPAAPTGVSASSGNQYAAINWSPAATATSYKIKRSTTSAGPYSVVTSGTVSAPLASFADTTAANGTTYYYVVTALNNIGEGTASAEVSATPATPPFTMPQRTVYQWSLPMKPFYSGTNGTTWQYDSQRRAYLWIPPGCAKVQGVMVGLHNMLEKPMFDDPAIRQACTDANIAILFITPGDSTLWTPNGVGNYTALNPTTAINLDPNSYYSQDIVSGTTHYSTDINPATGTRFVNQSEQAGAELAQLLTNFAAESGYSELQYAPLLLTDHSAGSPFCWGRTVASSAALTNRVFAIIPNKGTFPGNLSNVQGIPILHITSECQEISDWGNTWELGDAPAMRGLRAGGTNCLLGECIQPGSGHYEYIPERAAPIGAFIKAAAAARIPANWSPTSYPVLNNINPSTGWVVDTRYMGSGNCQAMSYPSWVAAGNDPLRAYWYPDQATAQSACDTANAGFSKKPQMISVFQNSSATSLAALGSLNSGGTVGVGYVPCNPTLQSDGASFQVRAAPVNQSPIARLYNSSPMGMASGSILFRANGSGSLKQTAADTFRVWLDRESVIKGGQPWEPFILAYQAGDSNYRSAYRPIQLTTTVPVNLISGSTQTISFPILANQIASNLSQLTLGGATGATASSGLPVQYWVVAGPYRNDENNSNILVPDTIPASAKFPMRVVIGAWQWGRPSSAGAAIQSATPVFNTFWIFKDGTQKWRFDNFGSYDSNGQPVIPSGNSDETANPSGDGIPNLMKYATGMSPLVSSTTQAATIARSNDGTRITVTFNRIADPTLTYLVEAADDITGTWNPIWSSTGSSNVAGLITVQDTALISDKSHRFLRLRVTH